MTTFSYTITIFYISDGTLPLSQCQIVQLALAEIPLTPLQKIHCFWMKLELWPRLKLTMKTS